ncbi:MAG: cyclic pyranopterin monophosphate synthase MoaC [Phycisphaeraceae bacterium]|nr:cyclic pyranopterin monophosphate synthase MoaC [Phycisphaeraceae bacterium]
MPAPTPPSGLSHLSTDGNARMVPVGEKPVTERAAIAEALVTVSPELARAIHANALAKGNLIEVARLAGIQAAKRTDEIIPLCHTLPLDHADVRITLDGTRVVIRAEARCHARTGVEMEALTAAAVAALTVIDMGKAIDKAIRIDGLRIIEKSGGRSGHYVAKEPSGGPGA